MTTLLCLLFFLGHLSLRTHWQALAFLALGVCYPIMTLAIPGPELANTPAPDRIATLLVCLFSALGYIAWRASRKRLESQPFGKERLLIFLGWGANGLLFACILWLTGSIPAQG